ncbi:hypothetical protein DdX_05540 [Ditylenchus destructor]|uniref:Uncharacterized protein n=1 Tax=Ditylenchus destructor TaxID=166010 RepID=A0AAD4N7S5_9BILA|nr:hypothetical protein DdX_05540 [Ditylenchus destructor]
MASKFSVFDRRDFTHFRCRQRWNLRQLWQSNYLFYCDSNHNDPNPLPRIFIMILGENFCTCFEHTFTLEDESAKDAP